MAADRRAFIYTIPVALLLLIGCGGGVPEEPAARVAFVRERMAREEVGIRASRWLDFVAHKHTEAGRELLLETMDDPRHMLSQAAVSTLCLPHWLEDPVVRVRLVAVYTDPLRSMRHRIEILNLAIRPNRARYAEFTTLPDLVEPPAGAARLVEVAP